MDASGTGYVRQSYGAFGLPRDGTDWDGAVPGGDQLAINAISRRGYTGHSMLGSMGLIHMNGRVHDATLGRFLSPDPTVPDPGLTQMYNRYAYVNNNPLSYTDPNGFEPYSRDELNYLLRRYEDIRYMYGAMCGGFSEFCASINADMQYYELMSHGILAQLQAWEFGDDVMARNSLFDSSPGVTHITVQVEAVAADQQESGSTAGLTQVQLRGWRFGPEWLPKGARTAAEMSRASSLWRQYFQGQQQKIPNWRISNPANDVPSWAKGNRPYNYERPQDFATRLMNNRYPDGWNKGSGEFSQIQKWGSRHFEPEAPFKDGAAAMRNLGIGPMGVNPPREYFFSEACYEDGYCM